MINSVAQVSQAPKAKQPTRTSIFYVNDLHGQTMKMERIYNASKSFDSFTPSCKLDKLKLSSGDTLLGNTRKVNEIGAKFLDLIGVTATAVGNHECDGDPKDLYEVTKDKKFKMLGLNVKLDKSNPLSDRIQGTYVQEQPDGNKYGIIGLMPPDLLTRMAKKDDYGKFLQIEDFDTTIKQVQAEVDKFKEQGIDKVIVVSHAGNNNEKRLAQETSGIDVILGGHSHELIKDIKEGENMFYSKTGEPVIITQAGKDADNTGVLNLEFDENGVITRAQNNVTPTKTFRRNLIMKFLSEKFLGKPEVLGEVKSAEAEPVNRLACENPHADFVVDSMREHTGADIAIMGAANMRNVFEKGEITSRDVSSIVPFKNGIVMVPVSEKVLVEGLKFGANSLNNPGTKPGLIQVSGLNYSVNKAGELTSATYVDWEGNKTPIDINNPREDKVYDVAMDKYYAGGNDGLSMFKGLLEQKTQEFELDKDGMAMERIKNLGGDIEIKSDGRIKVEG